MGKRVFQNCRFLQAKDILFADMEMFRGQVDDTMIFKTGMNDIYLI